MEGGRVPADRWTRIEGLFAAAAELPAEQQESFLHEACPDDAGLREEVLSLLRYDSTGEPPLADAVSAGAASVVRDQFSAGRRLGPYRIEHEIGRGGTAVVYLAARADGEFQKHVAIKLIKRGMDTAAVVERLRMERRILASLEHPSIARLLDGGTTPDGRPWIAMEYVEGLAIDRYCDRRGLGIDDRCRLAIKVCDAVAYAHRNLVVHRDLKPTNILIGGDGNPKLLDFGIAKLLVDDGGDGPLTRGPTRPLTPEYASPEQADGLPVGTSTDIYSLGVVLFELLAGERPPRRQDSGAVKASASALHAGKGARWAKQLTGDLDTILQMALRPEPERRYLTIGQLQSDLERHLAGLPVSARRETWPYRFGKLWRRHPLAVPAAAAMALAAAMGVVFIARAERDAQEQRRKAEQRLGLLVELANRALLNVHGSIERLPGATGARMEIVRTTLEYLDRLNAETGQDARVLSAMASAYARVARVQGSPLQPNLGDLKGAEASYQKAARILDALLAHGGDSDLRRRDAELRLEYGGLLAETGRKKEAVAEYRRGVEQAALVLAKDPRDLAARKTNSRLHLEISMINRVEDPAGVRQEDMALMPLYEALVREYPEDTDCLLDLASMWSQIGLTYDQQGKLAEAVEAYTKSTALRERIYAAHPEDVNVQHDLLIAYGHLGDTTGSPMFPSLGDSNGAVGWYRKAVEIAHKMTAADGSNVQARNDEGTAMARIAIAQTAGGEYGPALETFRSAAALLEPLRAVSPASVPLAQRLATLYQFRGKAQESLGQHAAAEESLRRAIAVCQDAVNGHADAACQRAIWASEEALGAVLAELGDAAGAKEEIAAAEESMQQKEHQQMARVAGHVAMLHDARAAMFVVLAKRASGRERAENWRLAADGYRRALAEWQAIHPVTEPALSHVRQAEAGLAECERALQTAQF